MLYARAIGKPPNALANALVNRHAVALALAFARGRAVLVTARSVPAATCDAAEILPEVRSRDAIMMQAGTYAVTSRYAEARALYLWLLARNAEDDEATLGLARIDAWEGCWALAEREYRAVLIRRPRDAEARGGLVDLLMWQAEWKEAEKVLEAGLLVDPKSPILLARLARFAYWRGDATEAVRLADEAERLSPGDADIREMRDRLFLGEARAMARVDAFPAGYQNLYTTGVSVLQRVRKVELTAAAQLLERYGGDPSHPDRDGRYAFGVGYHPAIGVTAGLEIGAGAPANAIPQYSAKLSLLAPITTKLSGYFAYAYWHFKGDKTVHIFAPALGVALGERWRLDVRYFLSYVTLQPPANSASTSLSADSASSIGVQLTRKQTARLDLGGGYTYGVQLDQSPSFFQLLQLRSHIVFAYADWLIDRHYGVRPTVALERREASTGAVVLIESLEVGAYVRW